MGIREHFRKRDKSHGGKPAEPANPWAWGVPTRPCAPGGRVPMQDPKKALEAADALLGDLDLDQKEADASGAAAALDDRIEGSGTRLVSVAEITKPDVSKIEIGKHAHRSARRRQENGDGK